MIFPPYLHPLLPPSFRFRHFNLRRGTHHLPLPSSPPYPSSPRSHLPVSDNIRCDLEAIGEMVLSNKQQ
ncbi:unnamed protein product [Citrullus colocynthis]|uniref:Uncharacterized protein n=1 Tax=Citrullus colocynthis TaxID=252529 RepID=A0ABP0Y8Q7_9ROSI